MKHATHCKFCQKPITLTIDDEYSSLGDPLKLIGLAACNECADLRVERRQLENAIRKSAMIFDAIRRPSEEAKSTARDNLTTLCQRYANMIARWHKQEGMAWDGAVVDALLENPKEWGEVLSKLWAMFRQWQSEQVGNLKEQE